MRVWPGIVGVLLTAFLLIWNGLTAVYANPFSLTQWYDGIQYQLLARNRLQGHTEIGDTAHTVRTEACHPMWRPGLVWIEQALAAGVGSVRVAAALASALGTTLFELALVALAAACFGRPTALVLLFGLLAPWPVGVSFLGLAVGQGPEPWAAAAIVGGLLLLVESARERSWQAAVLAGMCAGMAEWFRTGTLLLFAVPAGVYALACLARRDWLGLGLVGSALTGLGVVAAAAGLAVPSPVNKTVVNLLHNFAENEGPFLTADVPNVGRLTFSMGGYKIVPGTEETANDHAVRRAHYLSSREFLAGEGQAIFALYLDRLGQVATGAAGGLRFMVGDVVVLFCIVQIAVSLYRRDKESLPILALAGGALAYYLGPVVLLRGDQPTHYLLLALPLFLVVAARGVVTTGQWAGHLAKRRYAALADLFQRRRGLVIALLLAPPLSLTFYTYCGVLAILANYHEQARAEQAAVDHLPLEGKTVACRNMSWFVDRDVRTVLLPYATVPDLERYARAQRLDGLLVWDREMQLYFRATPYGTLTEFDRALRKSAVFGPPQTSGAWQWYPVRRNHHIRGKS